MRNRVLLVTLVLGVTFLVGACADSQDDDDAGIPQPASPTDDDPGDGTDTGADDEPGGATEDDLGDGFDAGADDEPGGATEDAPGDGADAGADDEPDGATEDDPGDGADAGADDEPGGATENDPGDGADAGADDEPGGATEDDPDTEVGGDMSARAAIDVDNHVAVLAAVFDAVAGTPHAEVRARVEAFAESTSPSDSEFDPESLLRSSRYDCGGGGSASRDRFEFVWPPESVPPAPPAVGQWGFADCIAGTDTFGGTVDVTAEGLSSEGLTIAGGTGARLRLVGTVRRPPYLHAPEFQYPSFATESVGATLERRDDAGEHLVLDLDSEFQHGILVGPRANRLARLDARLVLVSPLTGGLTVTVDTIEPFEYSALVPHATTSGEWRFTSGRLELAATDGSALVLEADTGGQPSAETAYAHARVTLSDPDGVTTELIEPWSLWDENLLYEATQRPWSPPPLEPDPRPDGSAVITADASLALLDEVFAVFAGGSQRRTLLAARSSDLSTALVAQRTVSEPGFGSYVLQDLDCEGGGTLAGLQGIPSELGDLTDGHWVYDGCTSAEARYDGGIATAQSGFVTSLASEAFTVENTSTGSSLTLDGTVIDHQAFSTSDGYLIWRLHEASMVEEREDGEHVVEAAETSFGHGSANPALWRAHLGGRFVLRSPLTGGRAVRVETIENFTLEIDRRAEEGTETVDPEDSDWQFPRGRLRIRAGDGSELVADAAAAAEGSLRVSVDDGSGDLVVSDEDWDRWREVLRLTR